MLTRFSIFLFCFFITLNCFSQSSTTIDSCADLVNDYGTIHRSIIAITDSGVYFIHQELEVGHSSTWQTTVFELYSIYQSSEIFDSSGRLAIRTYQRRDTSVWVNTHRTLYSYDLNGNLNDSIEQTFDGVQWVNAWHFQLVTDSINNSSVIQNTHWINGVLENINMTETYYDNSGRDTLVMIYLGSGTSWINHKKIRKLYNVNGLADSLYYSWDGTTWQTAERKQHFFNLAGLDTLELGFSGNNQLWDTTYLKRRNYNSPGNILLYQKLNYSVNGWENNEQYLYWYNIPPLLSQLIIQTGNDSLWDNYTKTDYTYHMNGDTSHIKTEYWNDSTWLCFRTIEVTFHTPFLIEYEQTVCNNGNCSNCAVNDWHTETLDSAGRLMSISSGGSHDYYDSTGFLYHSHYSHITMGGFVFINCCYHVNQLIANINRDHTSACIGDTVQINTSITGGWPPYSFRWLRTDGLSNDTIASPYIIAQNDGWYPLQITDTAGNIFTDSVHISIRPQVSLGNDTVICNYSLLTLSPGQQFSTYEWQNDSTSSSLIASTTSSGIDTVAYWVIVTDSSGCQNTDTIQIVFDICASIFDLSNNKFEIFPNPVMRYDFLKMNLSFSPSTISIVDNMGRIVEELKCHSKDCTINIPYESGIYFLFVTTETGTVKRRLVILE
jgi:hypothetical protein